MVATQASSTGAVQPKFKVGDCILHPAHGKRYIVRYVGDKEYRLSAGEFPYVYLPFIHSGEFRLCGEQVIDKVLEKYGPTTT